MLYNALFVVMRSFFFKEEVVVVRKSSMGTFVGCSCWLYLVTEGWLGLDQQFIGPLPTQP